MLNKFDGLLSEAIQWTHEVHSCLGQIALRVAVTNIIAATVVYSQLRPSMHVGPETCSTVTVPTGLHNTNIAKPRDQLAKRETRNTQHKTKREKHNATYKT